MGGIPIALADCGKTFDDGTVALQPLDLAIAAGETIVLLGPSGCGKTTTLRIIAGLESPDAGGRVLFDGADVTPVPIEKRNVGMVFQSYALFPNMTVEGNVEYGLKVRGLPASERAARVGEMLAMMRIEPLARRRVDQLALDHADAVGQVDHAARLGDRDRLPGDGDRADGGGDLGLHAVAGLLPHRRPGGDVGDHQLGRRDRDGADRRTGPALGHLLRAELVAVEGELDPAAVVVLEDSVDLHSPVAAASVQMVAVEGLEKAIWRDRARCHEGLSQQDQGHSPSGISVRFSAP